jgi:hypothetical protein
MEETGEWGPESIWEINYISEGGVRDWSAPIATGGSVYPVLTGIPGYVGNAFCDGWGFGPVAASAYEMYDQNDIRRDGGILNFSKHATETGASYTARWQDTGYFLLKYMEGRVETTVIPQTRIELRKQPARVYRYAETLLNAGRTDCSWEPELAAQKPYLTPFGHGPRSIGSSYTG